MPKAEGDATLSLSLLKVSAEHIKPEGYELTIGGESIQIKAATSAGFFYGVVTLAQLLVTGQGVVARLLLSTRLNTITVGSF
ncbi:glycoside hydrolase family 20 zincin-like fold domain-containing protein [Vibrio variabilis]|uniref:glycoside hydrolase family 20 zincin-like fold domain-containing protein n=1 Tax=Vibrio variabilis TaxID=990271 RepID=UPI000DD7CDFF|nr:glycoside hydrolase family 20 zincin-like fold domain-containing protein [Vibrio variabilis]